MRSERAGAARRADAVIAGAGLSGLITAALLSRRGLRVVVVDAAERVGGRAGSAPHRPFPDRDEVYWLDGGVRDGVDVGDLQVGWRWGRIAAREAGVEVPIRTFEPRLRVHRIASRPGGAEPRVCEGSWGAAGFAGLAAEAFGCAEADLPAFLALLAELGRADAPTRRSRLGARLGDWLTQRGVEPGVRDAVYTMVKVIYCEHPERVSVGRLMSFLAPQPELPALVTGFADHAQVGGMQGMVEPFAQAIRARGGEILLRQQPLEVAFDPATGRACGLAVLDPELGLHEVEAPHVVLAAPLWQALTWLPGERVPAQLAALADALADEQADAIGWHAGLRRLPRLRATGRREGHVGWNRVLAGPEGRFLGGFQLPSLGSRRAAPEGRHLLHAYLARWLARGERSDWAAARARLERLLAHLRDFYLDLDECIEWSRVQAVPRPACLAWFWSPTERHGVRVPGVPGVYLASSTFESEAGPVDICAHAALVCVRAIAEDAALPAGCAGVGP